MVDDVVSLSALAATSLSHTVDAPPPFVNSWAASSTFVSDMGLEKWTVRAGDPVLEIGPSHSSMSLFWAESLTWMSLVQLPPTPPPVIEETLIELFDTRTASTQASPMVGGGTDNVPPPLETCEDRDPTAE